MPGETDSKKVSSRFTKMPQSAHLKVSFRISATSCDVFAIYIPICARTRSDAASELKWPMTSGVTGSDIDQHTSLS
jgi:hypothetical protein